jgi:membrane protease YdiL (CAAX protease family)
LKDAARLLGYFVATILFGALAAPPLFWAAHGLAAHGILPALAQFDFEAFFHRAIMLGALLFIWPLLRWLGIRNARDLGLHPNPRWLRDTAVGFLISAIPLACCALVLIALGVYAARASISWGALGSVAASAAVVPFIEEALFRGLFLGVLLRGNRPLVATLLSAGIFSIVHFLKGPEQATAVVGWDAGFISLAHSLDQFAQPMLLLAGFTTLFLLGWILAEARLRTRSLWLPIGLHAGWIFASGALNKIAQREMLALPWLGKSLYVGIVPLGVGLLSWAIMKGWLKRDARQR